MFNSAFKPVVKVAKTIDKTSDVFKALHKLTHTDVLVGIPEAKSSRPGEPLNNAELGFILSNGVQAGPMRSEVQGHQNNGLSFSDAVAAYLSTHGDPMFHIPPRPFLEPAIEANMPAIAKLQGIALKAALDGKPQQVTIALKTLGLAAQGFVKGWFTDPRNNWAPNAPITIARKGSDRPMIDTGKLRNSITYVLRGT
jgi:hypothetical protein